MMIQATVKEYMERSRISLGKPQSEKPENNLQES